MPSKAEAVEYRLDGVVRALRTKDGRWAVGLYSDFLPEENGRLAYVDTEAQALAAAERIHVAAQRVDAALAEAKTAQVAFKSLIEELNYSHDRVPDGV